MTTTQALTPVIEHDEHKLAPVALVESARAYAASSRAPSTRKAYRRDWSQFEAWCRSQGFQSLPAAPQTVALYLADLADQGRKVSTIDRKLASICVTRRFALDASAL